MCGIAGWYRRDGRAVEAPVVNRQCAALRHRGPDDQGILLDKDFGFGMRRLSIIDVKGGHQPIDSEDGRYSIVFNGEIYNFQELRTELGPGVRFRTHSDTETIVAAFARWAAATWPRLDGMFAVAIWDRKERTLTLARDRSGMKPLYFTEQNGGFAFASEIPALLCLPGHRFETDLKAVDQFFRYGHLLPSRSIYREVRTLPPGRVMTIGRGGEPRTSRYWAPRFDDAPAQADQDWIEQLRRRWLDTVGEHMIADVEVGAFLSGGIDSSAVVAAMCRHTDRPVRTFSIGFPDRRLNEAPYAEAVAAHLGCDHRTMMVDLKRAVDVLPQVQQCYAEPFADPAAIPTYYLSEAAAREVKVVLSGDGGDEIFFGYRRHLTERRLAAMPSAIMRTARLLQASPSTPFRVLNRKLQRWQKALESNALPNGVERYFAKRQRIPESRLLESYAPAFVEALGGLSTAADFRRDNFDDGALENLSGIEQFALAEFTVGLPEMMLKKVDRVSMAHSLEVRMPMLGAALVDWVLAMPTSIKIRGSVGKYVLRRMVEPWLPPHITIRGKQGFVLPLSAWFAGDFGKYAHEVWEASGAADEGIMAQAAVARIFTEHRQGRRDHSRFLYALACYALWRSSDRERRAERQRSDNVMYA